MSNVQVLTANSAISDMITPIKFANIFCPAGTVAISGGGTVLGPVSNEDIGIDVNGPINAAGVLDGSNAGWRIQATNFFIDSAVAWSVRVFVICATVQ